MSRMGRKPVFSGCRPELLTLTVPEAPQAKPNAPGKTGAVSKWKWKGVVGKCMGSWHIFQLEPFCDGCADMRSEKNKWITLGMDGFLQWGVVQLSLSN